jgi:hypothetical protein
MKNGKLNKDQIHMISKGRGIFKLLNIPHQIQRHYTLAHTKIFSQSLLSISDFKFNQLYLYIIKTLQPAINMAAPLSVGLELEMHAIRLTFRQRGTDNYWPTVDAPALLADTLIGKESILEPMDPGNGFINPNPPHNVIWESNWGFRAVGDAFAAFQVTPGGLAARQAGSCVLELATAASPVNDVGYVSAQN